MTDEPAQQKVVIATEGGSSAEVGVDRPLAALESMLRRLTDFVIDERDQSGSEALSSGTLRRLTVVVDCLLADADSILRRLTDLAVREGHGNASLPASAEAVRRLGELVEHLRGAFNAATAQRTSE